jgi:hypothetical protein
MPGLKRSCSAAFADRGSWEPDRGGRRGSSGCPRTTLRPFISPMPPARLFREDQEQACCACGGRYGAPSASEIGRFLSRRAAASQHEGARPPHPRPAPLPRLRVIVERRSRLGRTMVRLAASSAGALWPIAYAPSRQVQARLPRAPRPKLARQKNLCSEKPGAKPNPCAGNATGSRQPFTNCLSPHPGFALRSR